MITIRLAQDPSTASFSWLDSRHTFSFSTYYDPNPIDFAGLRVINEDKVTPQAFGTHAHRDMEIISCFLEGVLKHKDSSDTGSIVCPESAGTGIQHSEYNAFKTEPVHFLQI